MAVERRSILVLGASGYVGSRLTVRLLISGHRVRASSRKTASLRRRLWSDHPSVELVAADVLEPASLDAAMEGCHVVYYLVHSMGAGRGKFAALDQEAARNVVAAAERAGVSRIVYLGGLGEDSARLSHHLRSRHEVGRTLASGTVPVVELRAAMIIGNGSASFEILRYLAEHLPAMITPRWVRVPAQPISIRDVLSYLEAAADPAMLEPGTYDVGGPDIITYEQLFRTYAHAVGLPKRWIVPVPVLTPRLSSYWIRLVTPVPTSIARPLAEGLRNRVVCREHRIRERVPLRLLTSREAILAAVEASDRSLHATSPTPAADADAVQPGDPRWAGGTVFHDDRSTPLAVARDRAWQRLSGVGQKPRWHGLAWMWRLRGVIDRLVGGAGGRMGRQSADGLREGDTLDSWRILSVRPPERLQLASEMRLPGKGVLEFALEDQPHGSRLHQNVRFRPRGLGGLIYWAALFPAHMVVFHRLFERLQQALEAGEPSNGAHPGAPDPP